HGRDADRHVWTRHHHPGDRSRILHRGKSLLGQSLGQHVPCAQRLGTETHLELESDLRVLRLSEVRRASRSCCAGGRARHAAPAGAVVMRGRIAFRRTWSNTALSAAAVVFLAVASSGCAAAGMAAVGPVMSAIGALADRTVERTLPGDLPGASSATLETISRLGLEIRHTQQADEAWTFEAGNEKVTVHG